MEIKNVQCRNCNKYGHLSKNCPEPKVSHHKYSYSKMMACFLCGIQGHLASQCPNKHCNNCGLPGHLYDSCTERAYWHKQCHRCSMTGHFFDVSTNRLVVLVTSCFSGLEQNWATPL
uniref:Zinc finger CCHC domain-containing protein 7 n=1 Tax=Takifugu rubripes TaxID=31033 RepID=A0A674N8F1_TAKRU